MSGRCTRCESDRNAAADKNDGPIQQVSKLSEFHRSRLKAFNRCSQITITTTRREETPGRRLSAMSTIALATFNWSVSRCNVLGRGFCALCY
jgi:hypothetical protein